MNLLCLCILFDEDEFHEMDFGKKLINTTISEGALSTLIIIHDGIPQMINAYICE